jgi:murein DD-endopeptidase MepM/ murein hydrolase activator NlpD
LSVCWPVDKYKVTSPFGWRVHPIEKTRKHHNGVDLWSSKEPCEVKAFAKGTVLFAGASKLKKPNGEPNGYGYYITIRHMIDGKYYTSLYCHLKKNTFAVKEGDKVEAGQVIGVMGTSGASTGKHLHWEIWKGRTHGWTADGKGFLDPIEFVKLHLPKK